MLNTFFNMEKFSLNIPITDWKNQHVWIVGASSGIGAALAQQFIAAGANVIVSARRTELLQALVGHAGNAMIVPLDVQHETSWHAAYAKIQARSWRVDLMIFCAAEYHPERSWEVIPKQASHTIHVNLISVYSALAAVLPDMMQRGQGGVAIVASVAGYMGLPNASVYGPAKAALINLAEILYGDLHPKGLNVYLINPGFVDTRLTAKNSFYMPALQTAAQASTSIVRGLERGQFEIHFPRRFTQVLKVLRVLPYRWRFFLMRQFL